MNWDPKRPSWGRGEGMAVTEPHVGRNLWTGPTARGAPTWSGQLANCWDRFYFGNPRPFWSGCRWNVRPRSDTASSGSGHRPASARPGESGRSASSTRLRRSDDRCRSAPSKVRWGRGCDRGPRQPGADRIARAGVSSLPNPPSPPLRVRSTRCRVPWSWAASFAVPSDKDHRTGGVCGTGRRAGPSWGRPRKGWTCETRSGAPLGGGNSERCSSASLPSRGAGPPRNRSPQRGSRTPSRTRPVVSWAVPSVRLSAGQEAEVRRWGKRRTERVEPRKREDLLLCSLSLSLTHRVGERWGGNQPSFVLSSSPAPRLTLRESTVVRAGGRQGYETNISDFEHANIKRTKVRVFPSCLQTKLDDFKSNQAYIQTVRMQEAFACTKHSKSIARITNISKGQCIQQYAE